MTALASTPADLPQFKDRALALRLMGLLVHWDAVQGDLARIAWTGELLGWEEAERARCSLGATAALGAHWAHQATGRLRLGLAKEL